MFISPSSSFVSFICDDSPEESVSKNFQYAVAETFVLAYTSAPIIRNNCKPIIPCRCRKHSPSLRRMWWKCTMLSSMIQSSFTRNPQTCLFHLNTIIFSSEHAKIDYSTYLYIPFSDFWYMLGSAFACQGCQSECQKCKWVCIDICLYLWFVPLSDRFKFVGLLLCFLFWRWTPLKVALSWNRNWLEDILTAPAENQLQVLPSSYISLPLMSIVKIARYVDLFSFRKPFELISVIWNDICHNPLIEKENTLKWSKFASRDEEHISIYFPEFVESALSL